MPLALRCPNGHKLNVPSKYAGRSVRCPACEIKFEVPKKGKNQPTKDSQPAKSKEPAVPEPPAVTPETSPVAAARVIPPEVPSSKKPLPEEPSPQPSAARAEVPEAEIVPRPPDRNPVESFLLERELMGTSLGYRPDQKHKSSTYWLAGGQALLACFTTIPAFWQMGADQVAPWIYLVLMLAFLQGAYAVWLCLSPDFSSAQVAMFASGSIAAIYAAATAVCWLTEARSGGWFQLGSLKIDYGNKPALWCAVVMLLACLVAYFCGHVSYRWQKTYHRLWPVNAR